MLIGKNLSLGYGNNLIYNNLSFTVDNGQIIGIMGKNGCGKTSLLVHIANLLDTEIAKSSGEITYDNVNLANMTISELCQTVGIIFQEPESQFFAQAVRSELAFTLENLCFDRNIIIQMIDEVVKNCGIEKLVDRNINTLSSGEKQLVAIACVLVAKPKILLADEITARTDMHNSKKIEDIIVNYAKVYNNIVFYVTHNKEDSAFCDSILELKKGSTYEN